ncbi:MAG: DUF4365 domain-containing protein [Pseudoxanthomonas mexicana]|nr:DUF4365 domain-containing protein [Pseudoxanthomonas mexicana]
MKYDDARVIGDIGELSVAKAFIRFFRWPCRQQTIALGIDLEIEITDQDGNATGKVVKVQVKTSMNPFNDGKHTVYLTREHIDYWKQFSVPVLLCVVSLATDEILWKTIEPDSNYYTEKAAKIDFNRVEDALTPNSKTKIERIAVDGSDIVMHILGMAENSITDFFDKSGNVTASIDNQEACDQHVLNGEIIRMAYRLMDLTKGRVHPLAMNRVNWISRQWTSIDIELDRQNKADFTG